MLMGCREERASQSVGTTVRVAHFLESLPVRKESTLKNSSKELANIRRLLQCYALARPTVRLSLRVSKAKSEKGNFTYAPKADASREDAVFKVMGKDCASQCAWSVWEEHGFEVQTCLPRPDAQASKINNVGSFLSIDARPVSVARGTPKQMVRLFKERLRAASPSLEGVKDPFICLNITCPSECYDPNIEPAKDNVLFDNPDIVLKVVEGLLNVAYPKLETHEESLPPNALQSSQPNSLLDEASQDDTRNAEVVASAHGDLHVIGGQSPSYLTPPQVPAESPFESFRGNMYGFDEEDVSINVENQPQTANEEPNEQEEAPRDISVSNPWTIARMNAPFRARPPNFAASITQSPQPTTQGASTMTSSSPTTRPTQRPFRPPLLSKPESSSPSQPRPQGLNESLRAEIFGRRQRNNDTGSGDLRSYEEGSNPRELRVPRGNVDVAERSESRQGLRLGQTVIPFAPPVVRQPRERQQGGFTPINGFQTQPYDDMQTPRPARHADESFGTVAGANDEDVRQMFTAPRPISTTRAVSASPIPPRSSTDVAGNPLGGVQCLDPAIHLQRLTPTNTAEGQSRRRRIASGPDGGTRLYRTRSVGLPLERVPANAHIQNVILKLTVWPPNWKLPLPSELPPVIYPSTFSVATGPAEIAKWTARVSHLLTKQYPGAEVVGHLNEILQAAILEVNAAT